MTLSGAPLRAAVAASVCALTACGARSGLEAEERDGSGDAAGGSGAGGADANRQPNRCEPGEPPRLVAGPPQDGWWHPGFLVDADDIFISGTGATVYKLPKSGGAPSPLIEEHEVRVDRIAADATHLFFRQIDEYVRVPKSGGTRDVVEIVAESPMLDIATGAVDVNAELVVFAAGSLEGGIWAVAKAGGTPVQLVDGVLPLVIEIDEVAAFYTAVGMAGRVDLDQPVPQTLLEATGFPRLAIDETDVFVFDAGDCFPPCSTIRRVSKAGGDGVLMAEGQGSIWAMAVDGDHVLYIRTIEDDGPWEVLSLGKTGGEPRVLASIDDTLRSIAVDATCVYVAGAGGVWTASR